MVKILTNFLIFTFDEKILKVVSSLHFYLMCNTSKSMAALCSIGFLKRLMKKILTNGQIFVIFVDIFTVKILCYTVSCYRWYVDKKFSLCIGMQVLINYLEFEVQISSVSSIRVFVHKMITHYNTLCFQVSMSGHGFQLEHL